VSSTNLLILLEFCAIYKWKNGLFQRQHKLNNKVFDRLKSIYSKHDFIITQSRQRELSFYSSNDIIRIEPGLVRQISKDVSDYAIFKSQQGDTFYVEIKLSETPIEISMYEIIVQSDEREATGERAFDPIRCIASLKNQLKNRLPKVQSSQQNVS